MSVITCKHCGKYIDTDFDCEHEEMCGEEKKMEKFNKIFPKVKRIPAPKIK